MKRPLRRKRGLACAEWKKTRSRRADRAPGRGQAGACPSWRLGRTGRLLVADECGPFGARSPFLAFSGLRFFLGLQLGQQALEVVARTKRVEVLVVLDIQPARVAFPVSLAEQYDRPDGAAFALLRPGTRCE